MFCDFCDCGIHPKCCEPPLKQVPEGDFICEFCEMEQEEQEEEESPIKKKRTTTNKTSIDESPKRYLFIFLYNHLIYFVLVVFFSSAENHQKLANINNTMRNLNKRSKKKKHQIHQHLRSSQNQLHN